MSAKEVTFRSQITHGSGDEPIDVSDVEDFTVHARDLGIGALELDLNSGVSQVGCHCEVGDGGDEGDGRCVPLSVTTGENALMSERPTSDVVENTG